MNFWPQVSFKDFLNNSDKPFIWMKKYFRDMSPMEMEKIEDFAVDGTKWWPEEDIDVRFRDFKEIKILKKLCNFSSASVKVKKNSMKCWWVERPKNKHVLILWNRNRNRSNRNIHSVHGRITLYHLNISWHYNVSLVKNAYYDLLSSFKQNKIQFTIVLMTAVLWVWNPSDSASTTDFTTTDNCLN